VVGKGRKVGKVVLPPLAHGALDRYLAVQLRCASDSFNPPALMLGQRTHPELLFLQTRYASVVRAACWPVPAGRTTARPGP